MKQRYGTELRSQTLSSIRPEISRALDSLLEEIHASNESKVLRSAIKFSSANIHKSDSKQLTKTYVSFPLCKQAGRPFQHFLSKCKYLPESDKAYLSKPRLTTEITDIQDYNSDSYDYVLPLDSVSVDELPTHSLRVVSTMRRISTKQSPQIKVFCKHFPLQLILDSGAEISMTKTSVGNYISAPIQKTNQKALQADGVTPLSITGETHIVLSRNNVALKLEALVVNDLDIDILAGILFMTTNDISLRPSKQQIIIGDSQIVSYGPSTPESSFNRVRRTQAVVLRSPTTSVIWPGKFLEIDIPEDFGHDCTLSIEARPDSAVNTHNWPPTHITEAINGKVRIINDSEEGQLVKKHEHFCQVCSATDPSLKQAQVFPVVVLPNATDRNSSFHSDLVKVDPDNILRTDIHSRFQFALQEYDDVFNPQMLSIMVPLAPLRPQLIWVLLNLLNEKGKSLSTLVIS